MPINRYFTETDLTSVNCISIQRAEKQHATRVMRREQGDKLELIDGRGNLARAEIISVDRSELLVKIEEVISLPRPTRELELVQLVPRWERLCWIIEKATELGVSKITLVTGSRKNCGISKPNRLRNLAIAALKQSGQLYLPELKISRELEFWPELQKPRALFYADQNSELSISDLPDTRPYVCALVVGAEEGFQSQHLETLKRSSARGLGLGDLTLRSETAAICGLFALNIWLRR